jgi:hypothetical protein
LKPVQVPFNARQVESLLVRLVLLEMQNVSAVTVNEVGNRGIESRAVRALNQ